MHFTDAKGILSAKNGMNIYRGCTHGCIYCDSRSVCYRMAHQFEDIEVKRNAPELLDDALGRKRKKCMIGMGSMCDPYMPCEKELKLTRRCLEIICDRGFGATLITKSNLVLRDLDILRKINEQSKCVVQITMTTYDEDLCRKTEPGVCTTEDRFDVLRTLHDNGIPSVVWISPLLPFINDTEENLKGLLGYCFESGVKGIMCFGIGVTLREGNREYFYRMLDRDFPGIKDRYIRRFGDSYVCASKNNDALMELFRSSCESNNIMHNPSEIFDYLGRFPESNGKQTKLF